MMLSYPFAEPATAAEPPDTLEAESPDAPGAVPPGAAAAGDGEEPAYTFDGFEVDSSVRIMLTPLGVSGGVASTVTPARRK